MEIVTLAPLPERLRIHKLVGNPGFEPGASRSRTAVAVGSGRSGRGRLGSLRPRLKFARCRRVTVEVAWVATRVATRGNETSVEEVTAIHILEPSHRTGPDTNPVPSATPFTTDDAGDTTGSTRQLINRI